MIQFSLTPNFNTQPFFTNILKNKNKKGGVNSFI